jgi:uncharacterized protein (DUF433 family)
MIRAKPKARLNDDSAKGQVTEVGRFLTVDPRVCHGELTFRGTRVPVETVLLYLAEGYSLTYLRKSWPEVSAEVIQEALSLATSLLARRYRYRNRHRKS